MITLQKMDLEIIAALVNRGFDYEATASDLGFDTPEQVQEMFHRAKKKLTHAFSGNPPSSWLSDIELANTVGLPIGGCRAVLRPYADISIEMKVGRHKLKYYPPVLVSTVRDACSSGHDQEQWLNAWQIKSILGVSQSWLKPRLRRYSGKSKPKIGSNGRLAPAYPSSVVEELRQKVTAREILPPLNDFLTANQIAIETTTHPRRVISVAKRLNVGSEQRVNSIGRIVECYPPELVEQIKTYSAQNSAPEGWISASEIAQQQGVTINYVQQIARKSNTVGQLAISSNCCRECLLYPPVLNELVELSVADRKHHGGWVTSEQIQRILGRSHKYVSVRLKKWETYSETRVASNHRAVKHYPPWVVFCVANSN